MLSANKAVCKRKFSNFANGIIDFANGKNRTRFGYLRKPRLSLVILSSAAGKGGGSSVGTSSGEKRRG